MVNGTYVVVPTGQPLVGTYETGYTYSTTGLLLDESPASGGGLPVDSLSWTYDSYGNPTSEAGYDTYVSNAAWTPYNQVSQIDLGTGDSAASLSYGYNQQTLATTGINLSDNEPARRSTTPSTPGTPTSRSPASPTPRAPAARRRSRPSASPTTASAA